MGSRHVIPNGKTIREVMEERAPGLYDAISKKVREKIAVNERLSGRRVCYYPQGSNVRIVAIRYYAENDLLAVTCRIKCIKKRHGNSVFIPFLNENRNLIMSAINDVVESCVELREDKKNMEKVKNVGGNNPFIVSEKDRKSVAQARQILLLLSEGLDPMTFERITPETMQREEIKKSLRFVADLLGKVDYEDSLAENVSSEVLAEIEKEENITRIVKEDVVITDKPIGLSGFVTRVNKAVAVGTKKMKSNDIYSFLEREGYLKKEEVQVVKTVTEMRLTEKSNEIGIINVEKEDLKTGEILEKVMLSKQAQEFIVENLERMGENVEIAPVNSLTAAREVRLEKERWQKPTVRVGQKWSVEEEAILKSEFEKGYKISEIARLHDRKPGGIRARLQKLGLIE